MGSTLYVVNDSLPMPCAQTRYSQDHNRQPWCRVWGLYIKPYLLQVTRVTELLPPIPQGTRPVPSFTGVSPLPVMQSLYSSTLSQLASSSYMSTSSLHYVTNSNSGASQFAAASQPQIQVRLSILMCLLGRARMCFPWTHCHNQYWYHR